ncbi:acyl carrier protein [Algoriphagus sp. A40]|uniref:acyl carrier protein n=1 Tax=Algoriphagus sp. A40 TaxID=1945863 RepID=UPI000986D1C2|nr:acyl carrier protein [Algoriphagus sp. A40]OOG74822.1 acyl carrier protein [Algoriphagus sp. A40]
MNQHYTMLKKAVIVFHSYGINLSGQRKNDHLIQQLNMDPVFVNGLIFELEFQLQVIIQEEKLKNASTPREIIELLLDIPQDN